jgi:hypothetical protein
VGLRGPGLGKGTGEVETLGCGETHGPPRSGL